MSGDRLLLAGRLFCVSNDDLLAPFREREREKHEEFCAMLNQQFGIRLSRWDFCTEGKDESGPIYSVQQLQSKRPVLAACTWCG